MLFLVLWQNGGTPLHLSAYSGHLEIVKALIKGRSDVGAKMGAKGPTFQVSEIRVQA
jgi:ankyrin repeat protein